MPKRSFPFECYSPQQLKNHVGIAQVDREEHMQEVYARTQNLLRKGAAKCGSRVPTQQGLKAAVSIKCKICLRVQGKADATATCSFCEKKICTQCTRQCVQCGDVFCSFCSTTNYDEPEERHFCLNCDKTR